MSSMMDKIDLEVRAKHVFDDHRAVIARAVGDIVVLWVMGDGCPRICVGDIGDAVLHLIEMVLADKGTEHEIPGVAFTVTIEEPTPDIKRLNVLATVGQFGITEFKLYV